MRTLICLTALTLAMLSNLSRSDDSTKPPAEFKTTAEIMKLAEKEDLNGLKRMPDVSSIEFRNRSRKAFVTWFNPYSGRAACHVWIHVFDDRKEAWVRETTKVFEKTHTVSVECGDTITIRDVAGNVIHRYPEEPTKK